MTKRSFLVSVLLSIAGAVNAQREIIPTDTLYIKGKIENQICFVLTDLEKFPTVAIEDQIIYNHKGEIKDTIRNLRGIGIKNVLSTVRFLHEKPKNLNEFYLVFIASDGYKVVFSWNEIFNNTAGDHFYIITDINGKKLKDQAQRIIFLATSDLKIGRRYIKGLKTIDVRQVPGL